MDFAIGFILAVGVGVSATWIGLDRERALYPAVMVVIASCYALFAIMADSQQALMVESIVAAAFVGASIAGFRSTLWIEVFALAAHGVFDLVHGRFINNPGVPGWWPSSVCHTMSQQLVTSLGCLSVSGFASVQHNKSLERTPVACFDLSALDIAGRGCAYRLRSRTAQLHR